MLPFWFPYKNSPGMDWCMKLTVISCCLRPMFYLLIMTLFLRVRPVFSPISFCFTIELPQQQVSVSKQVIRFLRGDLADPGAEEAWEEPVFCDGIANRAMSHTEDTVSLIPVWSLVAEIKHSL